MAAYGYTYRSFSTYNTVRDEQRGSAIKPFVPFVPNTKNNNPEGHVTKKTIVPVSSRPYDDDDDDDYKHHSSSAEAYPPRGDHDQRLRQKSPVHGSPRKIDEFLTKVHNEASRPTRSSPMTSTDWRHSPQPTSYESFMQKCWLNPMLFNRELEYGCELSKSMDSFGPIENTSISEDKILTDMNKNIHSWNDSDNSSPKGYGDYGGNKERHKPIGDTIRNDNHDGYHGTKGYGDYGNYGNKEGRKPIGSTIKNDNYDGYHGTNGYGDYGSKEGRKPIGSTIRNDNYDGYNGPNGYGDYSNREGYKPASSPIRKDNYDDYNGANNGYGGYGNYNNNKEGHRPFGSTPRNDNYDGYNGGNGYGDYGNHNKHKPVSSPTWNDNNDRHRPAENYPAVEQKKFAPSGWTGPKASTDWTAPPRKGTQLSEPTNDIDKALQLLKEAAKLTPNDHSNKGGHNGTGTTSPYHESYDDNYHRSGKLEKGMDLMKEAERLKNIVTGAPHSRSSVPIETATPNKDNATRRYGNFNLSSRPRTPPHVTFLDGRKGDYRENIDRMDDTRRFGNSSSLAGPVIDSREAEWKFKGKRV